jgi:hypothetical protein
LVALQHQRKRPLILSCPTWLRVDLTDEAVRLTRILHRLLPAEPEVTGLLALLLLVDARRPARTGAAGELIPLEEQDRSRWSASTGPSPWRCATVPRPVWRRSTPLARTTAMPCAPISRSPPPGRTCSAQAGPSRRGGSEYRSALDLTGNERERSFLRRRLSELGSR